MNLSTAIFLVPNAGVRAVKVSYDPDFPKNNNPNRYYKTLDPSLKKDDFVIVPTTTRHGFTVCRVEEIGVRVDYNSPQQYDWIVGKVDETTYKQLLEQEATVINKVAKAEEDRMRRQIAEELGIGDDTFRDIGMLAAPAESTMRGAPAVPAAPPPPTPKPRPAARSFDDDEFDPL